MSNKLMGLEEFYKLHESLGPGDVILDVRRAEEFSESHIPKALNIPVDEVANRAAELQRYSKIYIHCKRGGRAKTAYDILSAHGLTNLVCINDAGMDKWLELGYPAE